MTYQGEVKPSSDPAFKQFKTIGLGYRAMFMVLYTYQSKYGLNTLSEMISRYAPPIENHTQSYIDSVSRWSGTSADAAIDTLDGSTMIPIVAAMSRVENGTPADLVQVRAGWKLFRG